jgi:hypothetical protein
MYLASKINRRIDGMRPMLQGSVPLETVWEQTQRALKPLGVKVHFIPDDDIPPTEMSCSGLYDWSRKKQPVEITLHFHSRKRRYNFTEKNWQRFRFLVSQVVQHEFIHKHQYSFRQCFEDGGTCLELEASLTELEDLLDRHGAAAAGRLSPCLPPSGFVESPAPAAVDAA